MPLILCLLILIAALALCAALLPLALPLLILIGAVQVVLLYLLLWTALVRCRKGHPAWAVLERFRYAHRGLHDRTRGIPENSLAAFRAAVESGYGAELDVHLTKDGRLAVIHDDSLLRTAGADAKASQLTADELAQKEGTINYEVVCGLSKRVPRVYLKHGKVDSIYNALLGDRL